MEYEVAEDEYGCCGFVHRTIYGEAYKIEYKATDSLNLLFRLEAVGPDVGPTYFYIQFKNGLWKNATNTIWNHHYGDIRYREFNGRGYGSSSIHTDTVSLFDTSKASSEMYFSPEYGVIRIELDSTEIWDLLP